jgi:N-acyl-D-aspartate/D-glutamate deacylase
MRNFRFITFFLVFIATACQQPETYDLVISNGRVIDPETKLDAIRNIGIQDGMIVDISRSSLKGL